MRMVTFKQHDRALSLQHIVLDEDGFPLDLTVFQTVKFFMRQRGAFVLKVDASAVFVDKQKGVVRYDWAATDTDTAGVFFGEFELADIGGLKRTSPSRGQIRIDITADLDGA
jgi:BppU N-terminal domain